MPEPLEAFLQHDRTGGVPLLFPWSNRLRGDHYEVLGRRVDLRRMAHVHRDGTGRPMHGVLLRWSRWTLEQLHGNDSAEVHARGGRSAASPSGIRAELAWNRHLPLYRAFPFDFTLRLTSRVFEMGPHSAGLEIETEVEAGDTAVPLSFGWHPYLILPAPRSKCRVTSPALARVLLRGGVPERRAGTLVLAAPAPLPEKLARGGIDDLFAGVTDGMSIAVESTINSTRSRSAVDRPRGSDRSTPLRCRVAVEFVRGYRFAQIYAAADADFLCIEPMMAPTAALSDAAAELPMLGAGQRASALFRIVVSQH